MYQAFGRGVTFWEFTASGGAAPPPPPPSAKLDETFPVLAGARAFGYDGFGSSGAPPDSRTTGAIFLAALRLISGGSTDGVANTTNFDRDTWIPQAGVPVLQANGTMNPTWYRFFQTVSDRLGGYNGPKVTDVATAVSTTQEVVSTTTAQVQAVTQQAQANASALQAVKQVAQDAALPGSSQIPPVQLSPYETYY
jgi:hypothetical protein